MFRRSRSLRTSAAVLLLALTAACGSQAQAESSSDQSAVTLRVGATGWKVEEVGFRTLVQGSILQGGDEGHPVHGSLEGRSGMAKIASSDDEVVGSTAGRAGSNACGGPCKTELPGDRQGPVKQEPTVVPPSGADRNLQPSGRRGRQVQNTTAHYLLYQLLKQRAGSGSDVDTAALNGGGIDAFASYGTSIITAHQQGATTVGSGEDILSGNFLWTARDSVLKNPAQQAATADLIARITQAYAYVRDGREAEFAKVVSDNTHQPLAQAKKDLVDAQNQRPTQARTVGDDTIASQQKVADVFTELGALKEHLDVKSFWTTKLNTELAADLKKTL